MSNHANPTPDWLNAKYIEQILQKYEKDSELTVTKCDFTPGSSQGDNYACQIFRITLNISKSSSDNQKAMSLIAKWKPNTESIQIIDTVMDPYRTESKFLSKTLPRLRSEIQGTHLIGPKIYHIDDEHCLIVMEDLLELGFKLTPRTQSLNRNECLIAVENVARMHAASYNLIRDDPTVKDEYLFSFWKKDLSIFQPLAENMTKSIEENIDNWPISKDDKQKIIKFNQDFLKNGFDLAEFNENDLNVLQHGDFWKSNMMFRYDTNECRLFDYQVVSYNCYANDLINFLFTSADVNVILDNLEDILNAYQRVFDKISPNTLSFQRLQYDFDKRIPLGMRWMILFGPCMTANEPPDVDSMMNGTLNVIANNQTFVTRLMTALPFFKAKNVL